jgi:alpha-beta hydrolase superfamily lysophospholipase
MTEAVEHQFRFAGADGIGIAGYRWTGPGRPKGIVQIAHGLGEHALRYRATAADLVAAGYAVYANDHRGHGRTAHSAGALGDYGPGGFDALVDDMAVLTRLAREAYPGVPLALLGHSMGSAAAQAYVVAHSDLIDGLVLSGSAAFDLVLPALAHLVKDGFSLNASFEPGRTEFDWLSRDEAEVDAYVADPLCGFVLNERSMDSFAAACFRAAEPAATAHVRKDLPIYLFAGDRDPVNNGLDWLIPLVARYRDAGIRSVEADFYPDGRHEMLNETNRDEVLANLVRWLDARVAPSA